MPVSNQPTTRKPGQKGDKKMNYMPIIVAGAAVIVVILAIVIIVSGGKKQPTDNLAATESPLPTTDEIVSFSTPTPDPEATPTSSPQPTSSMSDEDAFNAWTPDPDATPSPSPKPVATTSVSESESKDALEEPDARYAVLKELVDYANMEIRVPWDKGFSFLAVYPIYHNLDATSPVYFIYALGDTNKKELMEVTLDARKKGPAIVWDESGSPRSKAIKKMQTTPPNYEFEDDRIFEAKSLGLLRQIKGKTNQWYNLMTGTILEISYSELEAHMKKQNIWTGKPLEMSLSTYLKGLRTTFGSKVPDVVTEKMMFEEWGAG